MTTYLNSNDKAPVEANDRLSLIALIIGVVAVVAAAVAGFAAVIPAIIVAAVVGLVAVGLGVFALIKVRRGEAKGRTFALVGAALGGLAIVGAIVAGVLTLNAQNAAAEAEKEAEQEQVIEEAQTTVIDDVKATVEAVKAYLETNPEATAEEIQTPGVQQSSPTVSVVIAGDAGSWFVLGTDSALGDPNENQFRYESYSNTFRGTGEFEDEGITVDGEVAPAPAETEEPAPSE